MITVMRHGRMVLLHLAAVTMAAGGGCVRLGFLASDDVSSDGAMSTEMGTRMDLGDTSLDGPSSDQPDGAWPDMQPLLDLAPSGDTSAASELEGTWLGYEVGGSSGWTHVYSGKSYNYFRSGENHTGTFIVDPGQDPKEIDVLVTSSTMPSVIGMTSLGIYKIVGKELTIAFSAPGSSSRPTSFSSYPGRRIWVVTKQ